MATESMYQAIAIAYLPAFEFSSKLDVQYFVQRKRRKYDNPARLRINKSLSYSHNQV